MADTSATRRRVWQETRDAVESGAYPCGSATADIAPYLDRMRQGTRLYLPEEAARLRPPAPRAAAAPTRVQVTGESTLEAARRLAADGPVAALNFASARNPGGGVANGAQAQEESLARCSALYDSLARCPDFYAHHRAERSLLYSDRVIYSPEVPVFRAEDGSWSPEPVPVSFLTCAAPNRGALERNTPELAPRIAETLHRRARGVLAVAADNGHRRLVLGAWGCGVFRNDPREVAGAFRGALCEEFAAAFDHITFAILDRPEGPTRGAFDGLFG